MRITNLTEETFVQFLEAWEASKANRFDNERTLESAYVPLFEERDTQIYSLPNGAFMLLRNAVPGLSASVQFISPSAETVPELHEAKRQLREAMRDYRLRRLNITYPTHLGWRDFKLLGFKHEGRIRNSVYYDGELIDADIMGALPHEVGISKRRKRKRYRSKRTKQHGSSK